MARIQLDKKDLQILKALQENSKLTKISLARELGLSPGPTMYRIKKLEEHGIIEGYHASVDRIKVGLHVLTFVLVNIGWNKPNVLKNFTKKIQKIDEIVESYVVTGEADIILKVLTKDIPTYEALLFKKLAKIEEIKRIKTLMVLSKIKYSHVLPLDYK